jgi:mRNA-degrading endonuclease RelE of RelBE toxin-antitoxin system
VEVEALGERYEILITKSPQKTLDKLKNKNEKAAKIISDHIIKLEDDPYTPRSGTDIDNIEGSNPPGYRLRIGAQIRVEYMINRTDRTVTITRIHLTKRRKSDYKK